MKLPRSLTLAALLLVSAAPALAADDAAIAQLNARLAALDANPDLREQGAYERLQAVQAISRYQDAKRSERDSALYVAQRRVEIAELAAQNGHDRQQLDALDQARNGLLLEASRRETARARQEAERLRVQQQIQAEEAERLRQQADAEAAADAAAAADQAITDATGAQRAKLTAARKKDAALARQEAELMSGEKLPKSTFADDGSEAFTLPASAFVSGKSELSASGKSAIKAMAAYLDATKGAKARIDGYGDKQTPGARRSAALRTALIKAGASKGRVTDGGSKGSGTKARAAVITVDL